MSSSIVISINQIKQLLEGGFENLLENAENFSSFVEELSFRTWSLTKEQTNFFTYLVRLKAEVNSNASLILDTEKTLVKKEAAMSKLLEEIWETQEAMNVHVFSLAAFFHEQMSIDFQINNDVVENSYLKERKNELKNHIKESITMILVKNHKINIFMQRRRLLNREILHLRNRFERTNESRRSIEALWARAIDAGKDV
ncbi:hypothetical protein P8452_42330 [Trifolium repens]|nr:hypothetical protein QL285_026791 [Trifolium repens]WJX56696.1 hypothetical protein P8452_42330 [Trifolium repens]